MTDGEAEVRAAMAAAMTADEQYRQALSLTSGSGYEGARRFTGLAPGRPFGVAARARVRLRAGRAAAPLDGAWAGWPGGQAGAPAGCRVRGARRRELRALSGTATERGRAGDRRAQR